MVVTSTTMVDALTIWLSYYESSSRRGRVGALGGDGGGGGGGGEGGSQAFGGLGGVGGRKRIGGSRTIGWVGVCRAFGGPRAGVGGSGIRGGDVEGYGMVPILSSHCRRVGGVVESACWLTDLVA